MANGGIGTRVKRATLHALAGPSRKTFSWLSSIWKLLPSVVSA